MNGRVDVYKEAGMSSHQVVHRLRQLFAMKRIGHSGTLDPMAEGVLNVYLGSATKFIDLLKSQDKLYRAGFTLGKTSDTLDIWGNVQDTEYEEVTKNDVEHTLLSFLGKYNQIPPMVSALKVHGQALYHYARQGIVLERQARTVEISALRLLEFDGRRGLFEMRCSKGTYVRSLIDDLGKALGQHAVMHSLIRLENDYVPLDACKKLHEISVRDIHTLDSHHPAPQYSVTEQELQRMRYGQEVTLDIPSDAFRVLLFHEGRFVGTATKQDAFYRREKLL